MAGIPRSKELLKLVMKPHLEVTKELLRMVKRQSTADPTHRFQIAAVTIFLAGVDKALSLALQLLYLAGKIEWKWLKPAKPEWGIISCRPGLTAKILKLKELGVDITRLRDLVDLRNEYIHSCSIYAGYSFGVKGKKPRLTLRANGPTIRYAGEYLLGIRADDIKRIAEDLLDLVSVFVDGSGWRSSYTSIAGKIRRLPHDPEPETSNTDTSDLEAVSRIIDKLNQEHIGEGLSRLLTSCLTAHPRL